MNDITWTELASETFAELRGVSGTKLKNPWKSKGRQIVASAFPSAIESEPSAQQLGAVQYENGKAIGVHLQIVQSKGFVVNGMIKQKQSGQVHAKRHVVEITMRVYGLRVTMHTQNQIACNTLAIIMRFR